MRSITLTIPGAVSHYIDLEAEISRRAVFVGKILIRNKHHVTNTGVRVAVPYLVSLSPSHVDVAVAWVTNKGPSVVRMPLALFEAGTPSAIVEWVKTENARVERSVESDLKAAEAARRAEEMHVLKNLIARYPAEARILGGAITQEPENG